MFNSEPAETGSATVTAVVLEVEVVVIETETTGTVVLSEVIKVS